MTFSKASASLSSHDFRRLRKCLAKFQDILPTTLSQIGFAATASIEQGTGVAHQCVHVARCVGRSSEDQARRIVVARAEQGNCRRVTYQTERQVFQ